MPCRRSLLGALGAASVGTVAGCIGGIRDHLDTADESPDPGADDPPPLPDATAEKMRWAHRLSGTERAHLAEVDGPVSLPTTLALEFRNDGTEVVEGNRHDWQLFKLVDGQWYPVLLSRSIPLPPPHQLWPGDRYEHVLHLEHDPIDETAAREQDRDEPTLGGIGGGRYAFYLAFADEEEVHAMTFRIDAPEVVLSLPSDIGLQQDGREASISQGLPHDAITLVKKVESDGEPVQRLIPEQLAQPGRHERPGILAIREEEQIELAFVRHRSWPGARHHRLVEFDGDRYRVGPVEDASVPETPDDATTVVRDWFEATEEDREALADRFDLGNDEYAAESYAAAAERFKAVAGDYRTLRRDWNDHAATYPRDRQADELFGDVDRFLDHRERFALYLRYAAEIRAGEFESPFRAAGKEGDVEFWEDQAHDRRDRAADRLAAVEDAVPGIS